MTGVCMGCWPGQWTRRSQDELGLTSWEASAGKILRVCTGITVALGARMGTLPGAGSQMLSAF